MSKETALAFLKKMVESPDLQDKLVAFAAEQGYEFTVDELSEAELEGVAGGVLVPFLKLDTTLTLGGKGGDELNQLKKEINMSQP